MSIPESLQRAEILRPRRSIAMALFFALLIAGCGGDKSAEKGADEKPPNPVLLVTAFKAEVHPMANELRLLGRTVATHHVIIRAPAAGRVIGLKLISGDVVHKGQVVAHVLNREIEAAEAGLAVARRIDPKSAAALADSVARYNDSAGIPVVAPESGVVSQPPVTSGQMVADLDPLVDLVDPQSLYIDASIPLSQLSSIKPGMLATVTTGFRSGLDMKARVAAMMPSFDTNTATSSVRLDFVSKDRISESGAPVEVLVEIASVPDAIVIPIAALFQDVGLDRYHVFVVGPDHRAHRTNVTIGIRDRERAQVLFGVKVGDLVVTSGGYALSDGLNVQVAGGPQ
ncbi:MAG: family efflux pump component [Candidatus Binatus sp.]|nr:family efflux pump component [Candidatus Binatus sp.]